MSEDNRFPTDVTAPGPTQVIGSGSLRGEHQCWCHPLTAKATPSPPLGNDRLLAEEHAELARLRAEVKRLKAENQRASMDVASLRGTLDEMRDEDEVFRVHKENEELRDENERLWSLVISPKGSKEILAENERLRDCIGRAIDRLSPDAPNHDPHILTAAVTLAESKVERLTAELAEAKKETDRVTEQLVGDVRAITEDYNDSAAALKDVCQRERALREGLQKLRKYPVLPGGPSVWIYVNDLAALLAEPPTKE